MAALRSLARAQQSRKLNILSACIASWEGIVGNTPFPDTVPNFTQDPC